MIKERIIKLKSQPRWVARVMFWIWWILWLWLALHMLPIGGSRADEIGTTSSYIHYETVDWVDTISICDPTSNWESCITMKNMNEWATQPWVGCINYANNCWAPEYFWDTFESEEDCNSRWQELYETCMETHSWEYWKHYQWWNNHGFLPCLDSNWCETFPWNEDMTTNERVDTTDYWPQNYFDRAVFSKITSSPYDWSTTRNDNLRWWANDSQANNRWYDETNNVAINVEDRQWPCEEWYHVPSIWEWNQVLKYWAEENGIDLYGEDEEWLLYNDDWDQNFMQFQEDFKIPFAGYRDNPALVYGLGGYANLWSSSPDAGDENARNFYLNPNAAGAYGSSSRADAFSVRCFKNSYLSFPSSEGGWDSLITVNIAALNSGQNTCSWEDYIFPNISALPTVQTISLAKRFSCVFWNVAEKAVTLQLSGDLKDWNGNVISWENVKLSNPEWTATPTALKNGSTYFSGQTFLWTWQTLFNKVANKIWEAYWSGVEIKITIPAWTPDGIYEGTLVLTY